MSERVSSHDHGNCALCDQLERELAEARAETEVMDHRRGTLANMLRYIAFVLTGNEASDSQLAADQIMAERDALQAKLAAAEQRERALRDELARRGFHATERAPCPQCLDALALTPPGPSVER